MAIHSEDMLYRLSSSLFSFMCFCGEENRRSENISWQYKICLAARYAKFCMKKLWDTLQTLYPTIFQQQRQIRWISKQKLYHKSSKNNRISNIWILMYIIISYFNHDLKERMGVEFIWWKTEVYFWSKYLVFIYKVLLILVNKRK